MQPMNERRSGGVGVASDRRRSKRDRRAHGEDDAYRAALVVYMRGRIVCDRCGTEQTFAVGEDDLAPCAGPLGIPCESETGYWLDDHAYWHP
jgi:hypothetical protein